VFLYANHADVQAITIRRGQRLQNRFGLFSHDDLIGLPYGAKVSAFNTGLSWRDPDSGVPSGGLMCEGQRAPWIYARSAAVARAVDCRIVSSHSGTRISLVIWFFFLKTHQNKQILYFPDITLVTACLQLKPGSVVVESGGVVTVGPDFMHFVTTHMVQARGAVRCRHRLPEA